MADRLPSPHHGRSESAHLISSPHGSIKSPNPASSILHEAIQQERTNRRLSRNLDSDARRAGLNGNAAGERDIRSSPISSSASGRGYVADDRRSSGMGGRLTSATKGMGAREMEEVCLERFAEYTPLIDRYSMSLNSTNRISI